MFLHDFQLRNKPHTQFNKIISGDKFEENNLIVSFLFFIFFTTHAPFTQIILKTAWLVFVY